MRRLRKYLAVFTQAAQGEMEYRSNFFLGLLSGSFVVVIQLFLWDAFYGGAGDTVMFGYRYEQMMLYLVMAGILSRVMATGFQWDIAYRDIKEGGLSRFLVQPIRYLPYRVANFYGTKAIQLLFLCILTTIVFVVMHLTVGLSFRFEQLWLLLPVILFGLMINCLMFYCVGALAFWVTEVGAFFAAIGLVGSLLSGGIFPLDVFGEEYMRVFAYLPFQYVIYFPLNIISGQYDNAQILRGMEIQLIWIVLFFLLGKFIWRLGSKRFIAAGG